MYVIRHNLTPPPAAAGQVCRSQIEGEQVRAAISLPHRGLTTITKSSVISTLVIDGKTPRKN
jgi:hypothetical protein